ncbi:MAG: hypothetical protein U5L75_01550 [Candidatus Campbellbacteria bacterium]|nr:hypothetical protein [Candidatus Campbellbacteria bacterium]
MIKKFIEENLPKVDKANGVEEAFEKFWESERSDVLKDMTEKENITREQFEELVGEYLYTGRLPEEQADCRRH